MHDQESPTRVVAAVGMGRHVSEAHRAEYHQGSCNDG